MKFIDHLEKLEAIRYMAARRSTGSLGCLASKLDISERTAERMINQLRESGYDITFSRFRNSYVLEEMSEENNFPENL